MLYEKDRPLRLGSRAIDILHALLERAGETVTKEQLIARAWPNTVVEEGNLRVHVAALRKMLGERHIENVAGRGYCFITPVVRSETAPGDPATGTAAADAGAGLMTARTVYLPQSDGLPPSATRIFGRGQAVAVLERQLSERRFITIVGTGGMGKTTAALAAAERMQSHWRQGTVFVDLASLTRADQVPQALAAALVMERPASMDASAIVAALCSHHLLLILDSCEHLLEAVSVLAEQILHGAPGVRLLATSREPLRAEGEWVHRLPALELPPEPAPDAAPLTMAQAMAYASVQLFVERVQAGAAGLPLGEGDVPQIADICRRLDGIPLAIELAAARVELLGVRGLVARLDDCCYLLKGGRRTAKIRHRTLEATLDWSYALLAESERSMLHRLSVFRRRFSLEEALAIGADGRRGLEEAMDALSSLVNKSMLATVADTGAARYRMLETTRSYAAAKLAESGEHDAIMARYAALSGLEA
ncbi:winged helix-turn-helix domain-containing protein [Pseudoduganella sp. LjRoot289]|uniref:ATP-binding protein n=1 Tax=Pseudoduganella sp. LjRoot289 TaxID=3342314 RepID=UPI003ECF1ADB